MKHNNRSEFYGFKELSLSISDSLKFDEIETSVDVDVFENFILYLFYIFQPYNVIIDEYSIDDMFAMDFEIAKVRAHHLLDLGLNLS